MKLAQGQRTFVITTGGTTTVTALVYQQGNKLSIGTEVYTWSDTAEMYLADHVAAGIDPHSDGTLVGYTGTPPNVYAYGGTWS